MTRSGDGTEADPDGVVATLAQPSADVGGEPEPTARRRASPPRRRDRGRPQHASERLVVWSVFLTALVLVAAVAVTTTRATQLTVEAAELALIQSTITRGHLALEELHEDGSKADSVDRTFAAAQRRCGRVSPDDQAFCDHVDELSERARTLLLLDANSAGPDSAAEASFRDAFHATIQESDGLAEARSREASRHRNSAATVAAIGSTLLAFQVLLMGRRLSASRRHLRRLGRRYASVVEATGEAIVTIDEDGRVTVVNPAATRLTERTPTELVGMRIGELLAPPGSTHPDPTWIPDVSTEADVWVCSAGGGRTAARMTATPWHDESEHGKVLLLRDVQAERAALADLERAERHARSIIETAGDAYVGIDASGTITGWNGAAAETFGWSADEAVGRELADLLVPERYRGAHRAGIARFLATREPRLLGQRLHLHALHRDGRELPVELTVWEVELSGGERRFSAFLRDVNDRLAAETAVRESERRLLQAEEVAGIGSWEWEVETGELHWTPGTYRLNDRDPDTFQPSFEGWLGTVHPGDRDRVVAAVTSALESGDRYEVEFRTLRRDGVVRTTHTVGRVERAEDGRPLRVLGTARDVTEERAVERLKDEFLAVASHELRTPLTATHGALVLLRSGAVAPLPAAAEGLVDIAVRNTDRLSQLVSDLLDVERLASGSVDLALEDVPLRELLEEVTTDLSGVAEDAGISVSVGAPEGAAVRVDEGRIVQVLTNLIGNALKFTDRGGHVEVEAAVRGDDVEIEVRDDGRGIPADQLSVIFDRFRQVDATDAREKAGSGLGLHVARELVALHGGQLTAHSDGRGHGSTFRVRLPGAAISAGSDRAR